MWYFTWQDAVALLYYSHMKSINYYDSSYSPNEACEATDNYMDCGACYDTGMIEHDVYCDCVQGKSRAIHDQEDESLDAVADMIGERMQALQDEFLTYGDC